jgi:hypothetical protein
MFWRRVFRIVLMTAGVLRKVYTGNGQTYALYVLGYFLALYVASAGGGGARAVRPEGLDWRKAAESNYRPASAARFDSHLGEPSHTHNRTHTSCNSPTDDWLAARG